MDNWRKNCSIVCFATLVAGCSHFEQYPDDPNFAPIYPEVARENEPVDGSIYSTGTSLSLYQDIKAHHVGDIITVQLNETTTGSKKGNAKLDKNYTASIPNPTVLSTTTEFSLLKAIPNILQKQKDLNLTTDISDSKRTFDGSGEVGQNNNLSGTITVTVTKIFPNGNLFVRGEKWITINHGDEFIRLSGVVRSEDIGPDNTITSDRLADARITYSSKGNIRNVTNPGWISKILNHWIFPI